MTRKTSPVTIDTSTYSYPFKLTKPQIETLLKVAVELEKENE